MHVDSENIIICRVQLPCSARMFLFSILVSWSAIMDIETDSGAKRNVKDDTDLFFRPVLSYEHGALPWSLAKANGQPVKMTKPQLLHFPKICPICI